MILTCHVEFSQHLLQLSWKPPLELSQKRQNLLFRIPPVYLYCKEVCIYYSFTTKINTWEKGSIAQHKRVIRCKKCHASRGCTKSKEIYLSWNHKVHKRSLYPSICTKDTNSIKRFPLLWGYEWVEGKYCFALAILCTLLPTQIIKLTCDKKKNSTITS